MKRIVLALALFSACGPVPPDVREIDAPAAAGFVLQLFSSDRPLPRVFVHQPESRCAPISGIVEPVTGRCVGGWAGATEVHVTDSLRGLWSDTVLAHELAHWAGMHHSAIDYAPGERGYDMVPMAQRALSCRPELDSIPE